MRSLVVLLAATGCDYAFGLAELDDPVAQHHVTGTYVYRHVVNDENHAPVPRERIVPATSMSLTATLDDGTVSPVSYDDTDGSFRFPVAHAGQRYRLQISNGEGGRGELQHSAPVIAHAGLLAGRVDRLPVTRSLVQFPTTLSHGYIASTGIYTHTYTAMIGNVDFDWRLTIPVGSTHGLLDATKHDMLYAYEAEAISGMFGSPTFARIRALSSMSVTQSANSVAVLPAPSPVPADTCVHMTAPQLAEAERMRAATPARTYKAPVADWLVFAMPAPTWLSTNGAIWVASAGYALAQDLAVTPQFHQPFPGTTVVGEAGTLMPFDVALPGTTPVTIHATTRVYAPVDVGTPAACGARADLTSTVAIAGDPALDGEPLDSDGEVVSIDRSRDAVVSWTRGSPGIVDTRVVQLFELAAVNGATTLVMRWSSAVYAADTGLIDPALLEAGKTYMLGIVMARSRPNADDGDLRTVAFPIESATIYSSTFTVAP